METIFGFTIPGAILVYLTDYQLSISMAIFIFVLFQFTPYYIYVSQMLWVWAFSDARDKGKWIDRTWFGKTYSYARSSDKDDEPKYLLSRAYEHEWKDLIGGITRLWLLFQFSISLLLILIYFILKLPFSIAITLISLIVAGLILPPIVFILGYKRRKKQELMGILGQEEAP